ncbi:hypothetical protein GW12_19940 [Acinetobacter sp. HR7]|nr:hypothetical protein GW12_19940 [Acinetobacter sp. HR7]
MQSKKHIPKQSKAVEETCSGCLQIKKLKFRPVSKKLVDFATQLLCSLQEIHTEQNTLISEFI